MTLLNKKPILALCFLLVIATSVIIYLNTVTEYSPIDGDMLVVMFGKENDEKLLSSKEWDSQRISIEWINHCQNADEKYTRNCVLKALKIVAKRAKANNKPLVVIAEQNTSSAVLRELNDLDDATISAIVLLQPAKFTIDIEKFNLPAKLVIISDITDSRNHIIESNNLASTIRNDGNWVWFTMLNSGENSIHSHPVLPYILSFVIGSDGGVPYSLEFDAESRWQHPTYNNDKFLEQSKFIEERKIDIDIQRILKAFYAFEPRILNQWPLETYQSFNLLKYRDSLPPEKQGRYATFQNRKGHKFYLDLQVYGKYIPEFVVAIDNEKNLYRLTSFYITKQYYSWRQGGPKDGELYSQSMGAFIHFQKPLPYNYELPYLQYSSILFETIEFSDENPYRSFAELSEPALRVMTLNCLPCHKVNGIGGAAVHLDYSTGKSKPGFAKPLLSYSKEVLDNFFYNQTATAKLIGVNPNYVDREIGRELIDWLQAR